MKTRRPACGYIVDSPAGRTPQQLNLEMVLSGPRKVQCNARGGASRSGGGNVEMRELHAA